MKALFANHLKGDRTIWMVALVLGIVSILAVYSACSWMAWRNDGGSGIGLVNMGSTPILATSAMQALADGASVADAAELAAVEADPQSDLNASPDFRRHLAKVLVRRALEACAR